MQRACENCEFWCCDRSASRNLGQCRRRPPIILTHEGEAPETAWPRTLRADWCGAFAAIKVQQAKAA